MLVIALVALICGVIAIAQLDVKHRFVIGLNYSSDGRQLALIRRDLYDKTQVIVWDVGGGRPHIHRRKTVDVLQESLEKTNTLARFVDEEHLFLTQTTRADENGSSYSRVVLVNLKTGISRVVLDHIPSPAHWDVAQNESVVAGITEFNQESLKLEIRKVESGELLAAKTLGIGAFGRSDSEPPEILLSEDGARLFLFFERYIVYFSAPINESQAFWIRKKSWGQGGIVHSKGEFVSAGGEMFKIPLETKGNEELVKAFSVPSDLFHVEHRLFSAAPLRYGLINRHGGVEVWDPETGVKHGAFDLAIDPWNAGFYFFGRHLAEDEPCGWALLSPDGQQMAISETNGKLTLWDPIAGKRTHTLIGDQRIWHGSMLLVSLVGWCVLWGFVVRRQFKRKNNWNVGDSEKDGVSARKTPVVIIICRVLLSFTSLANLAWGVAVTMLYADWTMDAPGQIFAYGAIMILAGAIGLTFVTSGVSRWLTTVCIVQVLFLSPLYLANLLTCLLGIISWSLRSVREHVSRDPR